MLTEHAPLSDEERRRIEAATRRDASVSAYRDLVRLVDGWKQEERNRKTALMVVGSICAPVVIVIVGLMALLAYSQKVVPPQRPVTVYANMNPSTAVKVYQEMWRPLSEMALSKVCTGHELPEQVYLPFIVFVEASGQIQRVQLQRSTGNTDLDKDFQEALVSLAPLPAFGPEIRSTIDVLALSGVISIKKGKCVGL